MKNRQMCLRMFNSSFGKKSHWFELLSLKKNWVTQRKLQDTFSLSSGEIIATAGRNWSTCLGTDTACMCRADPGGGSHSPLFMHWPGHCWKLFLWRQCITVIQVNWEPCVSGLLGQRMPSSCMLYHKAEELLLCPEHSLAPGLCSQHEASPMCHEAIGPIVSPTYLTEEGLLVGAHSWTWARICPFLSAATHI